MKDTQRLCKWMARQRVCVDGCIPARVTEINWDSRTLTIEHGIGRFRVSWREFRRARQEERQRKGTTR